MGAGGVIGLCGVPIRILYQKAFFDRNLNKNHNKFFSLLPLPLFLSIPQDGLGIVTSISISDGIVISISNSISIRTSIRISSSILYTAYIH